ncbi:PREDICTED: uncharacterized protein LOC105362681 [Ceratosolen solmsi marchali]|uniref:Uncharacterized protein LOC105362681 n=1 Tax=Ceratosolen solmsi marchali TaxID=326594 RepID=A0AAJ7DW01_9HYME|nr:PREDICTED: uncharacterized protein LOC105362681 [Ceratosolen solmsi marchali]
MDIIAHYEPLLKQYEKDDGLVILEAEEEPGTKVGENYMSVVIRTRITGKRGNGSPYRKAFMRKMLPQNSLFAKICNSNELFRNEAYFYEKIIPHLGPFGPDCLLAQPEEIIMEDLGARDFKIYPRRKMLDLEHCLAVVQTLASMHASSLNLKLKSPEKFHELVAPLYEIIARKDDNYSLGILYEGGLKFALLSMESIEERTPEVERATNFLRGYCDKVMDVMTELLTPSTDNGRYWVITHGDTWNNNILFLHDAQGKVAQVKLVDFQVTRHASATFDFIYFVYASARLEVLQNNIDELIDTYEQFFIRDLRKLDAPNHDLEVLARPGWFKDEIRHYGLFGFFGALIVIHAMFAEEDKTMDLVDP